MTIRPAEPADLEAILVLARACFGAGAWTREGFAPSLGRLVLVAGEPDAPCRGYVVVQVAADEAELESLAVPDTLRRQGLGTALLGAVLDAAQACGARQIYLEVRESNLAARAFYRRHGFEEHARRPGYYHNPAEPAVLMRRTLRSESGASRP